MEKQRIARLIRAALLAGAAVMALAALLLRLLPTGPDASTAEGRRRFLSELGWEIEPGSEQRKSVLIPDCSSGVMADYNALQRRQGFDLTPYAGLPVTVVTYALQEAPDELVTLWVCNGVVIAGDVHTAASDGWMKGIIEE